MSIDKTILYNFNSAAIHLAKLPLKFLHRFISICYCCMIYLPSKFQFLWNCSRMQHLKAEPGNWFWMYSSVDNL